MEFNILVVDDSAVMRAMIIRTLRLCGVPFAEIHEAGNGAEALELLNRSWIDLVLADINMPVMDGVEMIEKMRANAATSDIPVLVISTESSETRLGRIGGAAGFIHKPFTPEAIRESIIKAMGVTHEQLVATDPALDNSLDF